MNTREMKRPVGRPPALSKEQMEEVWHLHVQDGMGYKRLQKATGFTFQSLRTAIKHLPKENHDGI